MAGPGGGGECRRAIKPVLSGALWVIRNVWENSTAGLLYMKLDGKVPWDARLPRADIKLQDERRTDTRLSGKARELTI